MNLLAFLGSLTLINRRRFLCRVLNFNNKIKIRPIIDGSHIRLIRTHGRQRQYTTPLNIVNRGCNTVNSIRRHRVNYNFRQVQRRRTAKGQRQINTRRCNISARQNSSLIHSQTSGQIQSNSRTANSSRLRVLKFRNLSRLNRKGQVNRSNSTTKLLQFRRVLNRSVNHNTTTSNSCITKDRVLSNFLNSNTLRTSVRLKLSERRKFTRRDANDRHTTISTLRRSLINGFNSVTTSNRH